MSRTQLAWVILALITLLSGCRLGVHPFDYCGPVVEGGASGCGPRAGSILSGATADAEAVADEGVAIEDTLIADEDGTEVLPPSVLEGQTRVLRITEDPDDAVESDTSIVDGPRMRAFCAVLRCDCTKDRTKRATAIARPVLVASATTRPFCVPRLRGLIRQTVPLR